MEERGEEISTRSQEEAGKTRNWLARRPISSMPGLKKFPSSPGKSFRKNLKCRDEARRRAGRRGGRLSRLVENRSEGPEFEQWDAQRGCCRPRPPSIYFPFESFREFSARQRQRVRGAGFRSTAETWALPSPPIPPQGNC